MRAYQWLAAGAILAAFAAPVRAQGGTALPLGSNTNQNVTFNIINPTATSTTIGGQQGGFLTSLKLASFFHFPAMQSSTIPIGSSNFPAPGASPGASYLQGFGFSTVTPTRTTFP
jgi:hypothetical protein